MRTEAYAAYLGNAFLTGPFKRGLMSGVFLASSAIVSKFFDANKSRKPPTPYSLINRYIVKFSFVNMFSLNFAKASLTTRSVPPCI